MKIIKKIALRILVFIVLFLVLVTGLFLVNKKTGNITYLFNCTAFINTGKSMLPTIKPGDLIFVKKEKSYVVNDIISYATEDNYITTHRIIKKNNENYLTQGDNNNFVDGKEVSNTQIYGRFIFKIANVGNILTFIWKQKAYIVITILLIPLLMSLIIKRRGQNVR